MPVPLRPMIRRHTHDRTAPPPLHTPGMTTEVTPDAQRPDRVATPELAMPPEVREVDPSDATTFPRLPDSSSAYQAR